MHKDTPSRCVYKNHKKKHYQYAYTDKKLEQF